MSQSIDHRRTERKKVSVAATQRDLRGLLLKVAQAVAEASVMRRGLLHHRRSRGGAPPAPGFLLQHCEG